MKKYLIWGIVLAVLGIVLFGVSIVNLSAGNYVDSVGELLVALCDGFMSWDAFSNYKKTKQI